jgi:hypothetical protein
MMNKQSGTSKVREIIWLVIALITLLTGIYNTFTNGLTQRDSYMFFIMAAISYALYIARRNLRCKEENDK